MIQVSCFSALPPGAALHVEAKPPIAAFHTDAGEDCAIDDTCGTGRRRRAPLRRGGGRHRRRPQHRVAGRVGSHLGNEVECDNEGRTNIPGVVAVGDCASWHDPRLGRAHRVEHWTGAQEHPAIAVASLLRGSTDSPNVTTLPKAPYFWSDQYDARIQFAGHAAEADSVTVEEGSMESRSPLAVYGRGEVPVAVLAMNQPRLFGRWRRQLSASLPA